MEGRSGVCGTSCVHICKSDTRRAGIVREIINMEMGVSRTRSRNRNAGPDGGNTENLKALSFQLINVTLRV